MDSSGDRYTENISLATVPSAANVETWAAAYAAASQATLYSVTISSHWSSDPNPDNAEVDQRNSVKDGVNMSYKNFTTLRTLGLRLVAPIPDVMEGNLDIPVLASTELAALLTIQATILSGFSFGHAQYSERRERSNNPRIN
jgi:hypothetical protein